MKYKVGDKVRIKSKKWWNAQPQNNVGSVDCGADSFTIEMLRYNCEEAVITIEHDRFYSIDIDLGKFNWTDEMFEDSLSDNDEKPHITEQLIKDIAEVIKSQNLGVSVSENEGKLIIEPLKDEEKDDLPIDTPCMVSDNNKCEWRIRYYAGNGVAWDNGCKKKDGVRTVTWKYIIPCDKFNFENPEESLKYNIVSKTTWRIL